MNRRFLSIMTIDDHRAAARELATVHRGVAEFEDAILKIFEDARQAGRSTRGVRGRIRTNVQRIHKALDRIKAGMREVQTRTLPGDAHSDPSWQETAAVEPAATVQHVTGVLALDRHITAARAFGPAQPAVNRFLDIISLRSRLPVRIMDYAIRVDHLIQIVRCEMEDSQFYTLRGRGIPWVNCWLGPFNHFEGSEAGNTDKGTATLESFEPVTAELP